MKSDPHPALSRNRERVEEKASSSLSSPLPQAAGEGQAAKFLSELHQSSDALMRADHVLVCGAHPDDETIGCGGQLPRWQGVRVITVTDGAPRDLYDAHRYGFDTAEAYADARRQELENALSTAHIDPSAITHFDYQDQRASFHLAEGAERLYRFILDNDIRLIITHAYEGGHPDHDATACMVHLAARLVQIRKHREVEILEMPLYRAGDNGVVLQEPTDQSRSSCEITLTARQQAWKAAMIAAHVTQRELLAGFPLHREVFATTPRYDFAQLPNQGRLLYEHQPWGMTGAHWCELTQEACRSLGVTS